MKWSLQVVDRKTCYARDHSYKGVFVFYSCQYQTLNSNAFNFLFTHHPMHQAQQTINFPCPLGVFSVFDVNNCGIIMSGLNVNCFGECLNSLEDEGGNPQIFKNRKGRKCLTLVRRGKALLNTNNFDSKQSSGLETTQPQSRHLQLSVQSGRLPVTRPAQIEMVKPTHHPHIIYGRYSTGPTPSQITHRYYLPPQTCTFRERRLSEAHSKSFQPSYSQVDERSGSLESKGLQVRKDPHVTILPSQPHNGHFISVIREEMESEKRSSLFQGAKSILSKLASSNKNTEKHDLQSSVLQTAQKTNNFDIRNFYDNARLCQTQHAINNTHSTIKTQQFEQVSNLHLSRELSIDAIPMSPKSKSLSKYRDLKLGKLLGVGKWAHVYLCQQTKTSLIYSLKEIFKQSLQYPVTVDRIHRHLKHAMAVSHPNIISIYSKIETQDKVCLISQYCMRSIYEELKIKGQFSLSQIKSYGSDLVEGLVYLHQNDCPHGNVNIFSTYINFAQCKLKPNFTEVEDSSKTVDFKTDITSLAIVMHEMAYGISAAVASQETQYEKEKYYREQRKTIVSSIRLQIQEEKGRPEYVLLNSFIALLLNWTTEVRLTSGVCLNHPFLRDQHQS